MAGPSAKMREKNKKKKCKQTNHQQPSHKQAMLGRIRKGRKGTGPGRKESILQEVGGGGKVKKTVAKAQHKSERADLSIDGKANIKDQSCNKYLKNRKRGENRQPKEHISTS